MYQLIRNRERSLIGFVIEFLSSGVSGTILHSDRPRLMFSVMERGRTDPFDHFP